MSVKQDVIVAAAADEQTELVVVLSQDGSVALWTADDSPSSLKNYRATMLHLAEVMTQNLLCKNSTVH